MRLHLPLCAIWLLVLCSSVGAQQGESGHRFQYQSDDASIQSVHVAGDFNGWSTTATPMNRGDDGTWEALVPLEEGVHHYKFVVNSNQWITDPKGDKELEIDDTYGGKNSGVLIGPDGRKLPPPADNAIRDDVLRHDIQDISDRNVVSESLLRLSLRAQSNDADEIAVLVRDANDADWRRQTMGIIDSKFGFDRHGALVSADASPVKYVFELRDGDAVIYLAGGNTSSEKPDENAAAYEVEMETAFKTPDWAKHVVWYQIFPERFRNGEPTNDPGDKEFETLVPWTGNWWDPQPGEAAGKENFYTGRGNVWRRRYGGDIQGVRQALPYLKSLGVTAIYFNPIFEADSMHKYDTSDFRHIDDNFGVKGDIAALEGETDDPVTWQWTQSDKLFLDFVADAHAQGFRVILDGVFNHVGRAHPFFMDVLVNGPNSKYAGWFEITDWGDPANHRAMDKPFEVHGKPGGIRWRAWDGDDGHLPVFKKDAQLGLVTGPREHIFAVTQRWLVPDGDPSRGVDGFRLDVPGDIPHPFWIDWRKHVKSIKPDAFISGEIWTWAQPWLGGDQFDAVMNYPFATAAQDFFVDQRTAISPSAFAARLNQIVFAYPFQVALVQQNLFDSHDTDRLASMFVNPDRPYDGGNRIQDNGPDYSAARPDAQQRQRMKQAVTCQMTFVGAPMIYYGDEAGMWSPDDPSNRQPMVWKDLEPYADPQVKFDDDLFGYYQRLIALRSKFDALRLGFFHPLSADDAKGTFVFVRELADQRMYVCLNRSNTPRVMELRVDDAKLINWLDASHASVNVSPDGRPTISAAQGPRLTSNNGKLRLKLSPFESAVVTSEIAE